YKYYNMDQVVAQALALHRRLQKRSSIDVNGTIHRPAQRVKQTLSNGNGRSVLVPRA
ncbi:MAG: hypothetical protein H0W23_03715, partial [Chloroflexia bacterium]|nr:hypothetical protein [Chloroflexia bacterium]